MKYSIGTSGVSAFLFVVLFISMAAADPFDCSVLRRVERADAMAGALVCGKFQFDSEKNVRKEEKFELCPEITVAYSPNVTSAGPKFLEIISRDQSKKGEWPAVRFGAKPFPDEFVSEHVLYFVDNKKHTLEKTFTLNCRRVTSHSP